MAKPKIKFNDKGLTELANQAQSALDQAVGSVVEMDNGNQHPELVLEHLKYALRDVGLEPNEAGLRPYAEAIAAGQPLPDSQS